MHGGKLALLAVGLAAVTGMRFADAQGAQGAVPPQVSASAPLAVVTKYCVSCHNDRTKTAGLSLQNLDSNQVGHDAAVWERVIRQLRSEAMPPAGRPRPDPATYHGLRTWLESELDRTAAATPNPGKLPAFQRLTRTEYRNAVRDLLDLEQLPKAMGIELLLPADNATSGFDNIRDLLFVSPTQLEQYLSAARKISRIAVGDPQIPLIVDRYALSAELPQDGQLEGAPFGTRGGIAVHTNLPLDGEYSIEIDIPGGGRGNQLEVRVDGQRVQLLNLGETGAPSTQSKPVAPLVDDTAKAVTSAASTGTARFERDRLVAARRAAAGGVSLLLPLKAGPREILATFVRHAGVRGEELVRPPLRGRGGQPAISTLTIKGPYDPTGPGDTPSRRRIFVCRPVSQADERRCAGEVLSTLARRAYRRPVTKQDVQDLMPFFDAGRADGGFEKGVQLALERVLVSPQFLFRIEGTPAAGTAKAYRISDLELASRLSFFLWSSIPDDELLKLGAEGKLKNAQVLEQQVRRMLADERAHSLVSNFAAQWLYLRDLEAKNPNERIFRDFDEGVKDALERETELFVESVLLEDRSVLELLSANYTFLNERLAKHYGIAGVHGTEFRRVALDDASPRRGLIGKGSILTISSYATRTSPVLRGKYILDALLSSPPPPPPAAVPPLEDKSATGQPRSIREAMAQHGSNPSCSGCHLRMDPLGFALENFDAVGRWRDRDELGQPIDASAALPDGTKFEGAAGLRDVMLKRSGEFVSGMTEKLLMYALGRRVTYYDAPVVRAVVRDAAKNDYRFSSFVLGIVKSVPFQMRQPDAPASASRD
jgi:mono/diheme cytochrome c family protein